MTATARYKTQALELSSQAVTRLTTRNLKTINSVPQPKYPSSHTATRFPACFFQVSTKTPNHHNHTYQEVASVGCDGHTFLPW